MVDHLANNRLILPSQFGFMKRKSCLLNLLTYLEDITREVDQGNPVDIIYLDYAKAFDKVPHKRLIKVLSNHGIRGKTLEWIKNW